MPGEEPATQATQAADATMGEAQPCLMIKQLELTNFKSYANTVKIGPFDRHMTSVVGPNGSGKSNVIDAMLFVFGFKANKCARAHRPRTRAAAIITGRTPRAPCVREAAADATSLRHR